jgi:Domain of unknown function (DUF4251)
MKHMLLIVALAAAMSGLAQSSDQKIAAIKQLITSQTYVFVPQTALPSRGRSHQIMDNFDLQVTTNSLVSDLPYFGQASVAPLDPTKSPLNFTSHKFEYTVTPGKKEGWQVVIKPKDVEYSDVQRMMLDISSEGYTSLRVLFTNHDPITFSGAIVTPQSK